MNKMRAVEFYEMHFCANVMRVPIKVRRKWVCLNNAAIESAAKSHRYKYLHRSIASLSLSTTIVLCKDMAQSLSQCEEEIKSVECNAQVARHQNLLVKSLRHQTFAVDASITNE